MNERRQEALCNGFVLTFGVWTLLCHAAVFLGQSLQHLLVACVVVGPVALILWRRLREDFFAAGPSEPRAADEPFPRGGFLLLFGAGLVAATVYWLTHDPVRWWWSSLPSLVLGAALLTRDQRPWSVDAPSATGSRAVWAVAAAVAVLALLCTHSDADDAFYLSMATHAADFPHEPLLARDGILGRDLPLLLNLYRVHSFEVLGGSLAYLTRTPVLWWMHLVFPVAGAVVAVVALARVARLLVPRHWFWVMLVALTYLACFAPGTASHGGHGLARLYQGKALMLTAVFPLTLAHALDYVRRPSRRRWLLLAMSQVTAVGLSVNAVFLLPWMVLVVLITAAHHATWKQTGLGLLTLAYPLGLAVFLRSTELPLPPDWTPPQTAKAALLFLIDRGIGPPALAGFVFLVVLTAWPIAASRVARSSLWLLTAFVVLVVLNPYLAVELISLPERRGIYPRAIWILPLPLLVGMVSTAPLRLLWDRSLRRTVTVALTVAAFVLLPESSTLLEHREGWLARPAPKVPVFFDVTRGLAAVAGSSSYVLAPPQISAWLPALRHHPYPLYSREIYQSLLELHLGRDEALRRRRLAFVVAGRLGASEALAGDLSRALKDYDLTAVCLQGKARSKEFHDVLQSAGFARAVDRDPYEVWARTDDDASPE